MIIDSITLNNFRIYKGEHKISFPLKQIRIFLLFLEIMDLEKLHF